MSIDHNEGHAESCVCLRPGDRECNCHIAYGFATAEEMEEADRAASQDQDGGKHG
jgi:hypothetical protein